MEVEQYYYIYRKREIFYSRGMAKIIIYESNKLVINANTYST